MSTPVRYFIAKGKVQNAMFRQTLVRGAMKRNLQGGATNSPTDKNEVSFTLSGDNTRIQEIVDFLKANKLMNNWGARCTSLEEKATGRKVEEHQVWNGNVDSIKWSSNVEFFL